MYFSGLNSCTFNYILSFSLIKYSCVFVRHGRCCQPHVVNMISYQYSETYVMHFLFSLLRIKCLYIAVNCYCTNYVQSIPILSQLIGYTHFLWRSVFHYFVHSSLQLATALK
jgi:hypothetical protein